MNNLSVNIRTIRESDAEDFLNLCKKLDEETSFMMLEPGERTTSAEAMRERIANVLSQANSTILLAECDGQLAGYIEASGGEYRRNRHSAFLVIGILQAYTGRGIGTRLFAALEEWARQQHLHRLELTVMTHNQAGVALYKKRGFEIEGVRRHAMFVDGHYVDEYYMAKLL